MAITTEHDIACKLADYDAEIWGSSPRFPFLRVWPFYKYRILSVHISHASIDTRLCSLLVSIPRLQILRLEHSIFARDCCPMHTRLRYLQALSLRDSNIDDTSLQHIHSLPSLGLLDLGGTRVSGHGLWSPSINGIQFLYLDNTAIQPGAFRSLLSFGRLLNLEVSHTQLTDQDVAALAVLPQLEVIGVSGCTLSDDSLRALMTSSSISTIHAIGVEWSQAAVSSFVNSRRGRRVFQ